MRGEIPHHRDTIKNTWNWWMQRDVVTVQKKIDHFFIVIQKNTLIFESILGQWAVI